MRTDSEGACLRNIYYPIKLASSETSNYLELASGMMNGMVDVFSPTQSRSISGALEVCTHPHLAPVFHLQIKSLLQSPRECWAE